MAVFRAIKTGFWTDEKVLDTFSPEDRYFFLYLLTNPDTTQLGIYKFIPKMAAFYLGYTKEAVLTLIDRFETKYNMIRFSKTSNEIAIKNHLKHSIVKGGKPVMDCLIREEKDVKNKDLVFYIMSNLDKTESLNNTAKSFLEYLHGKYDNEDDNENDYDNDNEYENDNECNVDVSYNVTSTLRQKKPKHRYGEYNNVLLTDEEYQKLQDMFPDIEDRIERLSEYVASSGKSYKSHYATIRAWARKDKSQQSQRNQEFSSDLERIARWAEGSDGSDQTGIW